MEGDVDFRMEKQKKISRYFQNVTHCIESTY